MVTSVSKIFADHQVPLVSEASAFEEFMNNLKEFAQDLNKALTSIGSPRDVFFDGTSPKNVYLGLRHFVADYSVSTAIGVLARGASLPEMLVDVGVDFDPEKNVYVLFLNRDPDGLIEDDDEAEKAREEYSYPAEERGLQQIAVKVAAIFDEYLDIQEKIAFFKSYSDRQGQAILPFAGI